ncbi:hypothetical protein [Streptomyces sp. NPDC058595]|uniref:hypothetical protein n=1 Tax=unclassified Streptomyces TaxID=2593676 RepID=UPI00365361EE
MSTVPPTTAPQATAAPVPPPVPPGWPPAPAAAPSMLAVALLLVAFVVALLVCGFLAYLVYAHPASREPLGMAVGALGMLATVAAVVVAVLRRR